MLKFLIQYPCTPGFFWFGIFLICFLTFSILICISSCTVSCPSSFSAFLNQSVFSLCVTTWSHVSLNVYSPPHLVSQFPFVFLPIRWAIPSGLIQIIDSACTAMFYCYIFLVLLQQQLTSVKLLFKPLQHLSLLQLTFFPALIWCLHFTIPRSSFYLIVLTLWAIPSASLKFFIANVVVYFLSSPCFCNPLSQQQYCQQHVIPTFVSAIASAFIRDTILLIFTVAAITFFLSIYLRLSGIVSESYLIYLTTLINGSFSSSLYLPISSFFTNISSTSGNERTWYVFCCCSFSCPCSTKISCSPCSAD